MADNPRRADAPTPPPSRPAESARRPSPEFQQKLDSLRAQRQAKQDAGDPVHRDTHLLHGDADPLAPGDQELFLTYLGAGSIEEAHPRL